MSTFVQLTRLGKKDFVSVQMANTEIDIISVLRNATPMKYTMSLRESAFVDVLVVSGIFKAFVALKSALQVKFQITRPIPASVASKLN